MAIASHVNHPQYRERKINTNWIIHDNNLIIERILTKFYKMREKMRNKERAMVIYETASAIFAAVAAWFLIFKSGLF